MKIIKVILIIAAVAVAGFFGYKYFSNKADEKAAADAAATAAAAKAAAALAMNLAKTKANGAAPTEQDGSPAGGFHPAS